ncbi:hypothetical protein [Streptomyces sp. NPDC048442]|uniref:hypothetical protein n=1 Tax=Streptomyces sp. NPDC048442 TaxID=3154823 RepID=UPI00342B174C
MAVTPIFGVTATCAKEEDPSVKWARHRSREMTLQEGQEAASALSQYLQAGGSLRPVPAPGLALQSGEVPYTDVTCTMARWYSTEVVYPRGRAGFYEDHPAFGRRWVDNPALAARRAYEAEAEAEERWRDHVSARVVLTSVGLRVIPFRSRTWLPFDHALLDAYEVMPQQGALALSYTTCAPLLLEGTSAPWVAVALSDIITVKSWAP